MSDETGGVATSDSGVTIPLPLPNTQIFRYKAADDILNLLYRNPHRDFTITELRNTTNHGGKSVENAVKILTSLNLIEKEKQNRYTLIRINQERIEKPSDPVLRIPQEEFRPPTREFLEQVQRQQEDNLVGVILFGSVARGDADRASDIDLQVIVDGEKVNARRNIQKIRQDVENQSFNGNRYELQVLVESVESAENYGEKLQEIFSQGIVLHATDQLDEIQEVVFSGR